MFPEIGSRIQSNEDQQRVTFFVHGYNSKWSDEAARYQGICDSLFSGPDSLGECIMYDWPSLGQRARLYTGRRARARLRQ